MDVLSAARSLKAGNPRREQSRDPATVSPVGLALGMLSRPGADGRMSGKTPAILLVFPIPNQPPPLDAEFSSSHPRL